MSDNKVSIVFSVEPLKGARYVDKGYGVKCASQSDPAHDHKAKQPLVGSFRVTAERDEFFGGGKSRDYVGKPLVDPTWRQIKAEARKAAIRTGDLHHVFLEGVFIGKQRDDGTTELKLLMGS